MTTKEKIEQIAIETLRQNEDVFRELREKWTSLYHRYENTLRGESITAETESKVRLGQAYALVENFVSRIMAQSPRFRYLARERGDMKPAEIYNEYSDYQHEEAKSLTHYEEVAKWGAICGLSAMKMGWKKERIVRKSRGKEVIFGKVISDPTLVKVLDKLKFGKDIKVDEEEDISCWTMEAIRPHDLIWNVEATGPEDATVLGFKVRKTIQWLKANGYNVDELQSSIMSQEDYWRQQMSQYDEGTSQTIVLENIVCEIAELYVTYLNNNGVTEYYVVTVAGINGTDISPVAIRFEENAFDKKFCPIAVFRPIRRPGKFYGYGIIEPVESILDAEEDTLNMSIEQAWVDLSKPIEYDPNNVLDPEGIRYGARISIPVREIGKSVAVLPTPQVNAGVSSFLMGYLEKNKQNVSAITDYQTGANTYGGGTQTATEVNTKTFLSEQRITKILRSFETELLEVTGRMALWMNQQFLPDAKKSVYRILGRKGELLEKEIKFKDVEAVKDLAIITGSSSYVMREGERQKWMGLLQIAAQEASMGPAGVPIDREYIWMRLLEDGYFIKDPENLIPSLKEREEATVQQKIANMEDAKQENLDPATARVLPSDIHSVHIALHKAALQGGGMPDETGNPIPYTPEQLVMLTSHLNAHITAVGGVIPQTSQAIEQAMGQRINSQINPQMPEGGQMPQGASQIQ